jgi:hypothetical protein
MAKISFTFLKSRAILYFLLVALILAIIALVNVFLFPDSQKVSNLKTAENKSKIFASKVESLYNKIKPAGSNISLIVKVSDQGDSSLAQTLKINQSDTFELSFDYRYFIDNDKFNTDFIKKVAIHEYMHVLSLQNSEFKMLNQSDFDPSNKEIFDLSQKNCDPNYFNTEGCLADNSYLSQFYKRFWTGSLKTEYDTIQSLDNKDQFYQSLESWGQKYKDKFVSQIAFVSPEEDMAESFSLWVLDYDIENKSQVQTEKISFFEQYPELKIIKTNYIKEFKSIFETEN